MDIEKLIEDLHGILKQYGEKIPYGELVGAPWPYSRAGDLVWPDPEPYFIEQAATALSTLQAENEEMQKKLNEFSEFLCHMTGGMLSKTNYTAQAMISAAEDYQQRVCDNYCDLRADLARVTAERDAAVEAVKNMAEYIVCAGRVDYYLCDEISQEHHLKYQPKNDGNYDNEPCYKCIADWFLQGHKWQENCW